MVRLEAAVALDNNCSLPDILSKLNRMDYDAKFQFEQLSHLTYRSNPTESYANDSLPDFILHADSTEILFIFHSFEQLP